MLIIREVEYAIRIIEELYKSGPLPAVELSERKDIPSPFIYRVLKKLDAADILEIKRGPKGGYRLKADCNELTLYDVICAFENTFLLIECMRSDYDCSNNSNLDCCMHREYATIQSVLRTEFRRNSLASLFEEESCDACSMEGLGNLLAAVKGGMGVADEGNIGIADMGGIDSADEGDMGVGPTDPSDPAYGVDPEMIRAMREALK